MNVNILKYLFYRVKENEVVNEKKFYIYRSRLLLSIFLLILIEPAYFLTIESIHRIYWVGKFLVFIVVCMMIMLTQKKPRGLVWISTFYGVILFSTIINSGSIQNCIGSICSSLTMCLIFVLWLDKNPDTLLNAFAVLEIYIYINLVTILAYPNGMYNSGLFDQSWFLGFKNPQIRTILPIVCMALIRAYRCRGKITLSAALLVVLNGSSTGLVGIAVFVFLLIMFHRKYKKLPRIFNLLTMTMITGGLFLGIMAFQIQDIFSFLIVGVLGKDLNFTHRTGIWNTAIQLIGEKLLFGYGYLGDSDYASLFNFTVATHPHNYLLYISMTGGALLIVVWLAGIVKASRTLNENISSIYCKVILFTLCSFLVMGLTESLVSTELLYPMFVLGMKADKISNLPYQDKGVIILGKRIIWGRKG